MSKNLIAAIEAELSEARNRLSALEVALAVLKADPANVAQPKPGDRMADGTVYVGISPTDGRPLYAMRYDLSGLHTWDGAKTAAAAQTFAGRTDWRLPTDDELNMLYCAQEAVGGFKRDWYWSSSENNSRNAWERDFVDGYHASNAKFSKSRVRCVRSG
jgi:hypothetical protein